MSRVNYLLFHALVEFFAVAVACGIFMIAWNTRWLQTNGFIFFLGIASLFVAGIDFIHMLAYKNMGVFPGAGANLPTQLWIAARYLQSISLLLAPLFLRQQARPWLLFTSYLSASGLLISSIFIWKVFPVCFIDGSGLTPFKIASEYLIIMILAGALFMLYRSRRSLDSRVMGELTGAIICFIIAELAFTMYQDVYGIANMLGHLLKLAGFYLIYRGVVETGLTSPYDLLFRDLKQSEEKYRLLSHELEEANEEMACINEELQAANNELGSANLELETVNRELATANADLEAFNYTVSHDLRGPLTSISGYSQLIRDVYGQELNDKTRQFVERIFMETGRMDKLISTLLDFARIGRVELNLEQVDLSAIALTIVAGQQMREPDRKVQVTIADQVTVTADSSLMMILMENLLGNAWKYTGKTVEAQIEFGTTAVDGTQVCFVRDNGIGFDMAQADRLFNPFQRLHDKRDFEGHGIGLTTVQRIVQRHGGRLWAAAEPNNGATFFFALS